MVLQACKALDNDPVLSATLTERSCAAAIASARAKIIGVEGELLKVSQLMDAAAAGRRSRSGGSDLQAALRQRLEHLAAKLAALQAKVSSQNAKAVAASQAAAAAMQAHRAMTSVQSRPPVTAGASAGAAGAHA